ncbi:MAG: PhoH family protein, partial [Thermodesulfobacteriota bacterium]
ARVFSKQLDGLRIQGRLAEGVPLSQGGSLRVEINHQDLGAFSSSLDIQKYDNRILAVAHYFSKAKKEPVILVTKDLNLRIKADVLGIPAEDFYKDKINFQELYTGVGEYLLSPDDLNLFYRHGKLPVKEELKAKANQFYVLKNQNGTSQSALARYFQHYFWPLSHGDSTNWGIRALNKEQKFALELLSNDHIKVVTLVGNAGTGKTLLAVAVGLEKVVEQNNYTRLLITRPVIPMGQDLGYLPGTKEEKLRPWMQPIFDNLEFLSANAPEPLEIINDLKYRGLIELEALTYIRGRSIPNQFIICDEAQNLSPHMIKTLITRVGKGTKIVFTGDLEQIDHPYLDVSSNGLAYLVERMKDEEITGHVTLVRGERSQVAELGARLL